MNSQMNDPNPVPTSTPQPALPTNAEKTESQLKRQTQLRIRKAKRREDAKRLGRVERAVARLEERHFMKKDDVRARRYQARKKAEFRRNVAVLCVLSVIVAIVQGVAIGIAIVIAAS